MVTLLVSFIILVVTLVLLYVSANSFSPETAELLYPVAGALLFSLYLAGKSVFLDVPDERIFKVNIGVLQNGADGTLSGMVPFGLSGPYDFDGSLGIGEILANQNFSEKLRYAGQIDLLGDSYLATMDAVEYRLITWLADAKNSPFYKVNRAPGMLGGNRGGSAELDAMFNGIAPEVSAAPTKQTGHRLNPLLKKINVIFQHLPKGSRIILHSDNGWFRNIIIETPFSKIIFEFRHNRSRNSPADKNYVRLCNKLNLEIVERDFHVFQVNVAANIKPLRRYHKMAKLEKEWFGNLEENLNRSFSLERLTESLLQSESSN